SAVHADAVLHAARWEVAGQRTGCVNSVVHVNVAQAVRAPDQLGPTLQVDSVDQQREGKIGELPARHDGTTEIAKRLLEVDRWRPHALHQHSEMVDAEDVATAERLGACRQVIRRHSAYAGGGEQRADARPSVERRRDLALLESFENTDVRKAFHATATEDESNAAGMCGAGRKTFDHGIRDVVFTCLTFDGSTAAMATARRSI